MSGLTPIQKRAARRARNQTQLDMNLVSLIDVFTLLIFFLLTHVGNAELLASPKSVKLPESVSEQSPKQTVVVVVSRDEILVEGQRVAGVAEAMAGGDVIEPLQASLQGLAQRGVILQQNEAQSRAVTLLGDKELPYQLLRKVMATAARAGYTDIAFGLRQKEGAV